MKRPLWSWGVLALALVWLVPLGALVWLGLLSGGDSWPHLVQTRLTEYLGNTAGLTLGTLALAGVLGVLGAWLTTRYTFPGRKLALALQILPLALPGFLAAAAWRALGDYTGPWATWIRSLGLAWEGEPPGGLGFGIFLLGLSLYPYVLLTLRGAFGSLPWNLIETARLGGLRPSGVFFLVALPWAAPALVGGLSLVAMETLNEWGLPNLLGFSTFSTGIIHTWRNLGDLGTAAQLSLVLLGFWAVFFLIQKVFRRGKGVPSSGSTLGNQPEVLRGPSVILVWVLLALPVVFGFVIPLVQMGLWLGFLREGSFEALGSHLAGTLGTAAAATALGLTLAGILGFTRYILPRSWGAPARFLAPLGYAIPGAVLAIALMAASSLLPSWGGQPWLLGTWFGLVMALVIRFTAVAVSPLEGTFGTWGPGWIQAGLTLGQSPWKLLTRVYIPLGLPAFGAAFCLMTVDLLKELPLSTTLQPFDFYTLATRTYEKVQNEYPADAAPSAFLLVILAALAAWGAQYFLARRPGRVKN